MPLIINPKYILPSHQPLENHRCHHSRTTAHHSSSPTHRSSSSLDANHSRAISRLRCVLTSIVSIVLPSLTTWWRRFLKNSNDSLRFLPNKQHLLLLMLLLLQEEDTTIGLSPRLR
ncbi:hypothetical protein HN51_051605, partial [Arachis hypogaea]